MEPDKAEIGHWKALAGNLKSVMGTEAWDSYRKLLEDTENDWIQRMLGGEKDTFDFHKGVLHGLRLAYHIPEQIIERAARL